MDTPNTTPKIMENKIAALTFFTFLLFIVSAARLAVDPPLTNPSAVGSEDVSKASHQSADSNILLPGEKANSDFDETTANSHLPEPEKTTNDLTPRANFSRFHPINRHFHGKVPPRGQKPIGKQRRTCRHPHPLPQHKNPRTDVSEKNDDVVVVPNRMDNLHHAKANDVVPNRMDNLHHAKANDVVPNRMDNLHHPKASRGEIQSNWFKVKHHYGPRRHHNNNRNNNDNMKQVFDREKLKSSVRQQKLKKREEEAGFMKSIRKFLKHTFD